MYKIIPAAYIFTHVYLNTMQQGIQSLHCVAELFVVNNIVNNPDAYKKVMDWGTNYKTVRILSARGGEDFDEALLEAKRMAMKYKLPWAEFLEPDINSMVTAFGFIVTPEMAFEVETDQEACDGINDNNLEAPEGHKLAQFLSEFPSAR